MKQKRNIKSRLIDSFKELARKIPVEKITVNDIASGAGVIRPTFYHHFQDKYQMLEYIFRTDVISPIHDLINNDMFTEAVTLVFIQLGKDREFYSNVSKMEGQNSFEEVVKSSIHETMLDVIESSSPGKESPYRLLSHNMLARYYAELLGFIVMYWIKDGMSVSPKEMAVLFDYIKDHSLYEIIREME